VRRAAAWVVVLFCLAGCDTPADIDRRQREREESVVRGALDGGPRPVVEAFQDVETITQAALYAALDRLIARGEVVLTPDGPKVVRGARP
jgi:hypothetical protein